jgi:hypothetical protein
MPPYHLIETGWKAEGKKIERKKQHRFPKRDEANGISLLL